VCHICTCISPVHVPYSLFVSLELLEVCKLTGPFWEGGAICTSYLKCVYVLITALHLCLDAFGCSLVRTDGYTRLICMAVDSTLLSFHTYLANLVQTHKVDALHWRDHLSSWNLIFSSFEMEVIQVGTLPPGERFNYFLPNLFSGSKDLIYSHPSFTKNELHLPNHYFLVPTI
jgi:hypothetical protein